MIIRFCLTAVILTLPASLAPTSRRETRIVSMADARETSFAQVPPEPWGEAGPADSLYRLGREAINRGDFRRAATLFAEISAKYPRSQYAPDALYWRAFALYRSGREDDLREALRSLDTQRARFPRAQTIGDARELAVRIRGVLAQQGDVESAEAVSRVAARNQPCVRDDNDSEVRAAAMNALLQMDAESAVPIIKQVLQKRDECSVALREKAVFLLSQKPSSETETLLLDVLHNDPSRSVREQAIFWLGQRRSQENAAFLRGLFGRLGKAERNEDIRKKVLFSLSQMRGFGNDRWLLNIALDTTYSEDVRGHALWTAGQAGIPGSDLVALYDRLRDAEVKEKLIWVLSESRDRAATDKLVEIAQKDPDREMRKKALFWLGQKNDPRVRQIIVDI